MAESVILWMYRPGDGRISQCSISTEICSIVTPTSGWGAIGIEYSPGVNERGEGRA